MNHIISTIFWTIVYHYSYTIFIYKEVNILITGNNPKSLVYTMASPEAEIHLPKGAQEHFYQEMWRRRGSPFVYILFYLINYLGKDYQKTWTCRSSGLNSRMSRAAGALNLVLTKISIKDVFQDVSKWDLLQIVHDTKNVIFLDTKSTAFVQPVYCHRSEMWKSHRWGGSCRPTCAVVQLQVLQGRAKSTQPAKEMIFHLIRCS